MSVYAVGDVHGCHRSLESLIESIGPTEEDRLVFLGDYVDRGEDVQGCIDLLLDLSDEVDTIFLKGNHELMMTAAAQSDGPAMDWLHFGGAETLESYGALGKKDWVERVGKRHWKFLYAGLAYYEWEDYIFVHAGLETGVPLDRQNAHHLYWQKYEVPEPYSESKTVICGHTSRKNGEIADFGHTICIDTYAYGGQWLTALDVETKEYIQTNEKGEVEHGRSG